MHFIAYCSRQGHSGSRGQVHGYKMVIVDVSLGFLTQEIGIPNISISSIDRLLCRPTSNRCLDRETYGRTNLNNMFSTDYSMRGLEKITRGPDRVGNKILFVIVYFSK